MTRVMRMLREVPVVAFMPSFWNQGLAFAPTSSEPFEGQVVQAALTHRQMMFPEFACHQVRVQNLFPRAMMACIRGRFPGQPFGNLFSPSVGGTWPAVSVEENPIHSSVSRGTYQGARNCSPASGRQVEATAPQPEHPRCSLSAARQERASPPRGSDTGSRLLGPLR